MSPLTTICIIVHLILIQSSSAFNFWDYCTEATATCVIDPQNQAYAAGSAFEQGSTNWYLLGGHRGANSFIGERTVTAISLPLLNEANCSYQYQSLIPERITQSAAAAIDGQLYSFGGFDDRYRYIDDLFNSTTTSQAPFGMKYVLSLIYFRNF